MSGAGGIETAQLQPLDENPEERRRAAVTCAAHILEEHPGMHPKHLGPDARHQLLELLRTLGLAHDPLARDRNLAVDTSRPGKLRGPE